LLINLAHEREVQRRFALGPVAERGPRDRQQSALLADEQIRIGCLDHLPPHFPVHGLSILDKKIVGYSLLPDLGLLHVNLGGFLATTFEDAGCAFQQRPLPSVHHRPIDPKLAFQLGRRLLILKRFLCLELRRMLLLFRDL
jgi:hypothetical protein